MKQHLGRWQSCLTLDVLAPCSSMCCVLVLPPEDRSAAKVDNCHLTLIMGCLLSAVSQMRRQGTAIQTG